MTRVTLENRSGVYTVEARGHATGSAETCTAVSTLVQTLQAWLQVTETETITEDLDSGYYRVSFRGDGADVAFDVITAGFMRLAVTRPQYVKVEQKIQ